MHLRLSFSLGIAVAVAAAPAAEEAAPELGVLVRANALQFRQAAGADGVRGGASVR